MKKNLAIVLSMCCMTSQIIASDQKGMWNHAQQLQRCINAKNMRITAANDQFKTAVSAQPDNGDEKRYADRRGNFAKSLLHDSNGHVNLAAYQTFLKALISSSPADFNAITMGGARQLTDPQAAYSFSMEGEDAAINVIPPAPKFASAQAADEMVEDYWHALLRDVPFNHYHNDPLAAQAIQDLNNLSDFRGPKRKGNVTANTLFKLGIPGALIGPFISQFLYLPIPNLGGTTQQVKPVPLPGIQNDFLINFDEWFTVQNGGKLTRTIQFTSTPTFIRTGRDLGDWVHSDFPGQEFFQAALILLGFGPSALDNNHPYKANLTQTPYVSYGITDLLSLVCGVTQSGLKAAWYQKWLVNRRLRPEEFGFLVNDQIVNNINYGIHSDLLNSQALVQMKAKYGTYFLPQQYPEGCPTHPSYPCGHGVLSGACTTLLKAWFNEDFIIPNPVKPNADNTELIPYTKPLTVGGELNKLCSNISKGRDIAGVHYRSDCQVGVTLGEAIAIAILSDEAYTKNINFKGFSLTKFDGTVITIGAKKLIP